MSALAWITAIFEEKKRNSRGDGENAESCGTEVRGKNRPANPLWSCLSQGTTSPPRQQFPRLRASAPPRETNSRQMPPISALAWITAIFEEKKRNSRGDGENAESCGTELRRKNRPANPLWGRLSQGTTPPPRKQFPHLRASGPPRLRASA